MLGVIVREDSLLWRVSSPGGGGEGRGEHWTGQSENYEFKFHPDRYGLFTMVPSSRSQLVWLRPVEILNLVMFIHLFV